MSVPFKRPAADKSGIPVYQPGATTYQQLMQLQQPYVPVSCEYPSPSPSAATSTSNPQSSTANLISSNNSNHNNNSNLNNNNNNVSTVTSNMSKGTDINTISNTKPAVTIDQNDNNATDNLNLKNIAENNNINTVLNNNINDNIESSSNNNNAATNTDNNNSIINNPNTTTNGNSDDETLNSGSTNESDQMPNALSPIASAALANNSNANALSNAQCNNHASNQITSKISVDPRVVHHKSIDLVTSSSASASINASLIGSQPPTSSIANTVQYSSYLAQANQPYTTLSNASAAAAAAAASIYSHPLSTQSMSNQSLYTAANATTGMHNAAALAKEVAQKNYENALKLAASNMYSGKPLTALNYKALMPQQTGPHLNHHGQAATMSSHQSHQNQAGVAAHFAAANQAHAVAMANARQMSSMSAGVGNAVSQPYTPNHRPSPLFVQSQQSAAAAAAAAAAHFLRPSPGNAANPNNVQAALSAAQQQLLFYPGLAGMPSFPLGFGNPNVSAATNLQAHQVANVTQPHLAGIGALQTMSQVANAQAPGTAVVLNPYKKMKTS